MALVNVVNMLVLDNPTSFTSPFQFEITFECLQELDDDLEWKVLYVGSAKDASRDQILDEILVGPIPVGVNKFVLEADAPDPSQLAQEDLLGVTVVLVTCSYKDREFVRVGYYVNNEYHDPNAPPPAAVAPTAGTQSPQETALDGSTTTTTTTLETEAIPPTLTSTIPNPVPLEHIQRQILADKPRVTKFPIPWGDEQQQTQQQQQQQQVEGVTTDAMGMMAPPSAAATTVTPPGIANNFNENDNDNSMMMMDDNDEEEEEEDDDDENEDDVDIDIDDDAGVVSSSGVVSMPEESNMSHSYFHGGNNKSANSNNNSGGGGVQAMAE